MITLTQAKFEKVLSFSRSRKYITKMVCGIFLVSSLALGGCVAGSRDHQAYERASVAPQYTKQLRLVNVISVPAVVVSEQAEISPERLVSLRQDFMALVADKVGVTVLESPTALDGDAKLVLTVGDFSERKGNAAAASEGARIATSASLVSKSGVVLWEDAFNYTDKPLTENLLAFSKSPGNGLVFSTGVELQKSALDSMVNELATARSNSFLVVKE